jgi:ketosteroid isomerase-like protein
MDYQEAKGMAKSWCDAWTRGDLDAVMEHYADNVRFSSPTVIKRLEIQRGWLEGKEKLREHFAVGIRAPNLRFDFVDVLLGVDGIAIAYRRETGALVVDLVELDKKTKVVVARAYYSESRP